MNKIIQIQKRKRMPAWAALSLFLFLSTIKLNGITIPPDTLPEQFPITDPRNPNCPCHQHQKLADEEYNKYLASVNNLPDLPETPIQNISDSNVNSNTPTNTGSSTNLFKKGEVHNLSKRKLFKYFKRWSYSNKGRHKKHKSWIKRNKTIDDCFRWK